MFTGRSSRLSSVAAAAVGAAAAGALAPHAPASGAPAAAPALASDDPPAGSTASGAPAVPAAPPAPAEPPAPAPVDLPAPGTALDEGAIRADERARIEGITSHAEAKGREPMANHLAFKTNASIEEASVTLATAPRGGAALDAMRGQAPNLGTGAAAPAPAPGTGDAAAADFDRGRQIAERNRGGKS